MKGQKVKAVNEYWELTSSLAEEPGFVLEAFLSLVLEDSEMCGKNSN